MILTVETLRQIAQHFTLIYSDEVANNEVTSDMISEWWGMACDQYGYSQENKGEVISDIEKEIYRIINTKKDDGMKQLELHREGINAHNNKVYFYGVDYQKKQVLFAVNTEEEAYDFARNLGYEKHEICRMY